MATIKIKGANGAVLFSYNCKNNSLKLTLEEAVKQNADVIRFIENPFETVKRAVGE
jgi:hypothetical protein